MNVQPKDLIGRTITDVDLRPFDTMVRPNEQTTDPILTLDNGKQLSFVVCETETGEYGVELNLSGPSSNEQEIERLQKENKKLKSLRDAARTRARNLQTELDTLRSTLK